VVPAKAANSRIPLIENEGKPRIPQPYLPEMAICEPRPTRVPEIMSLRVDILATYAYSS